MIYHELNLEHFLLLKIPQKIFDLIITIDFHQIDLLNALDSTCVMPWFVGRREKEWVRSELSDCL